MGMRRGREGSIRFSSNCHDSTRSWHFRKNTWTPSESDRDAIVVWLLRNRGPIAAQSWLILCAIKATIISNWWATIFVWSWSSIPPLHRIKRPKFVGQKSPLKRWCIPSFLFNFWLIREEIKRIWSKILCSSWSPYVQTQLRSNWSGIDHESSSDFIEFSPWIPNLREEEIEQICFNQRELKPHSCGNQVKCKIWSIITW